MASTEQNIRQRLRSETAASHRKLDSVMGQRDSFSTLANYQFYLQGMRQLYVRCDESLRWASQAGGLPMREPNLIALIDVDLASLSTAPRDTLVPGGCSTAPDSQESSSVHWGQAYVMEGSSIGATMMVRAAEKKLPAEATFRFLTELSGDAKNRWPDFANALAAADVNERVTIDAAIAVFDFAYEIFSCDSDGSVGRQTGQPQTTSNNNEAQL